MSERSEAEAAGWRVDAYLATIDRIEPEITPLDRDAALASIAISLKRLADMAERLAFVSDSVSIHLVKRKE